MQYILYLRCNTSDVEEHEPGPIRMAVPQLVEILKRPTFREIYPAKDQDVC